jgi:NADH dehydrogenase FAD-containing subunit
MGKHLVLVGGGHAHLTVLLNLSRYVEKGHRVTVIMPSPYQYYSGMGPGMLSGMYRPQEVRFHIQEMTRNRGGIFLKDKVSRIHPANHSLSLLSGQEIPYDVVSFNTGSEVPAQPFLAAPQKHIRPVKPVVNLLEARRDLLPMLKEKPLNFVVIGGGPAGVEISANLWRLVKDSGGTAKITLIGGQKVLGRYRDRVRDLAIQSLTQRRVDVLEGLHLKEIHKEKILLANGESKTFDFAFLALGVKPSSLFRDSGLSTGEDGGLLVNSWLQSVDDPVIFGGGDCISLAGNPLSRVGVYAVRQNPILFHNLLVALEGGKMQVFTPQKDFMLILNMGNGRGILWKKNFLWEGRLSFLLKDYIDRKFMKTFQVSREREEEE